MGLDNVSDAVRIETAEELKNRYWQAYLSLGGTSVEWFDAHVDAVVRAVLHLPPSDRPRFDKRELLPWGRPVETAAWVA